MDIAITEMAMHFISDLHMLARGTQPIPTRQNFCDLIRDCRRF